MKNVVTTIYLLIAGMMLVAIGGAILLVPHVFHAGNDIALGNNPNLLSEIRAPGGLLLCSGITILISAFRKPLRSLTVTLSVLVYGSFGVSRLVSMALDGMPSSSIVGAMAVELTVATVGVFILWGESSKRTANHAFSPVRASP